MRQFGTLGQDEGEAVAVDAAGASWVVGMTSATLPDQTSSGTVDAFIRHYNAAGAELWTRQFGSWDNDFAKGVAVDPAGDAYVVGQTFGSLPGQTSAGGWDAYVRKYSPAGVELWTRQFGSGGAESLSGVAVDAAGNVTVAGSTRATIPGQSSAGEHDGFVRRYDPAGNELWTRQFGTHEDDFAVALAIGPGDDVVVTGGTTGSFAGAPPPGSFDVFVRRFDAIGSLLWARQFGSVADDYGLAVTVDAAGNAFVAGCTGGALSGQVSSGLTDAFVRKYDQRGAEIWMHQFGTAGMDDAEGIALDPAGNVSVAGRLDGTLPPQPPSGGPDIYASELDPTGRELWTTRFGSDEPDYALGLALDPAGSIYITGGTLGSLPGQVPPAHERDAFVAKLG